MSKLTIIPPPSDGFDTPDNDTGGAAFIKFDGGAASLYFDRGGKPVPRKPWIAVRCHREAVRWLDKKIIERVDEREDPDVDALNKAIPQTEWEEGFDGDPKPPWSMQYSIFLVNPENGSRVIFSNSTFGQKACYGDLKGRVSFMRKMRGEHVVPVVELSSCTMKTRFGTKSRPHIEIISWQTFGGPSGAPAIPGPVAPPTAAEIVGDSVPDHPAPKKSKVKTEVSVPPWDDEIPDLIA